MTEYMDKVVDVRFVSRYYIVWSLFKLRRKEFIVCWF